MRKRNRIFRAVLAVSLCINLVACMPPTTSSGNEEKRNTYIVLKRSGRQTIKGIGTLASVAMKKWTLLNTAVAMQAAVKGIDAKFATKNMVAK